MAHRNARQALRRVLVCLALLLLVASCTSASNDTTADEPNRSGDAAVGNPGSGLQLIAHRGLHQTFSREGLTDETCTAERMDPPVHGYLENTVDSIAAAFEQGAAVVEIDIAPTADDVLVVFHDWTVDCRTEASGAVRDMTWAELSTLDIGYGYTSDGVSFPFRGQGVGLIPRLEEVFETFPDGRFLINFKSNDIAEAALLFELQERSEAHDQIWAVYGAHDAVVEYRSLATARGFSEQTVAACLVEYAGVVPEQDLPAACHNTIVALTINLVQLVPGGPEGLAERLAAHDSELLLSGANFSGIDTAQAFEALPAGLEAFVWTDRIDLVGDGG